MRKRAFSDSEKIKRSVVKGYVSTAENILKRQEAAKRLTPAAYRALMYLTNMQGGDGESSIKFDGLPWSTPLSAKPSSHANARRKLCALGLASALPENTYALTNFGRDTRRWLVESLKSAKTNYFIFIAVQVIKLHNAGYQWDKIGKETGLDKGVIARIVSDYKKENKRQMEVRQHGREFERLYGQPDLSEDEDARPARAGAENKLSGGESRAPVVDVTVPIEKPSLGISREDLRNVVKDMVSSELSKLKFEVKIYRDE